MIRQTEKTKPHSDEELQVTDRLAQSVEWNHQIESFLTHQTFKCSTFWYLFIQFWGFSKYLQHQRSPFISSLVQPSLKAQARRSQSHLTGGSGKAAQREFNHENLGFNGIFIEIFLETFRVTISNLQCGCLKRGFFPARLCHFFNGTNMINRQGVACVQSSSLKNCKDLCRLVHVNFMSILKLFPGGSCCLYFLLIVHVHQVTNLYIHIACPMREPTWSSWSWLSMQQDLRICLAEFGVNQHV